MYSESTRVDESRVEYKDGDVLLEGFLCRPSTNARALPAVLVCHAFAGITEFEEDQARKIAKLGYVSFCVDVYGKGKRGTTTEESRALLQPFREDRPGLLRQRLLAGLNHVKSYSFVESKAIAVIGFCFGGLCALDLARINSAIVAAVSFHGALQPLPDQTHPEELEPIKASILVCHGYSDTHIPISQCTDLMAELKARKADWYFTAYGDAKHGFTEPKLASSTREGIGYDQKAANRSWEAMVLHLRDSFSRS
ncbi:dienelactone hydrolase family domain-containing protein [Ditylenchus destructor]|nr:dienelactone hydrolase family domain-containing protein [Ditylenchus destructor]